MTSASRPTPLALLLPKFPAILRNTAIATVAIVGLSFLLPNRYMAASVMLPPNDDSELMGLFSGIAGGAGLARGLGLSSGSRSNVFIGVLRSARINQRLVEGFNLVQVYKAKDAERAGRELGSSTSITLTNEGFIRVAVTDKDRSRAAELANAYVEELDRFLRDNAIAGARQRRGFLEKRLAETQQALIVAEDAFQEFQVRKRLPLSGEQGERAAEAAAELIAQKVRLELELGTLESVSRTANPRAEELRMQIQQIDAELVKIPPSATELARLYRHVRIQERILIVLAEESERARVMELKNIPVVEVVDRATLPLHKSSPRRSAIAAATFAIALAVNGALFYARESTRIG